MNQSFTLEQQIEALLFWKGEPLSIKELASYLSCDVENIENSLTTLEESLKHRGLTLIHKDSEVMLGTSPEAGTLIEKIAKEELSKDLGKAALETLAIILYKGPIKRSEIDYIRGVNSSFILRNLLIRGLIDKKPSPNDQRTMVYSASFDILSHLGISRLEDLPDFSQVQEEIKRFKETHNELNDAATIGTQTGEQQSTNETAS